MAAVKRSLNVAVVGLGRMGVPIARNVAFKSRGSMYLQLHSRSMQRARRISDDIARDGAQCAMRLHDKYSTVTKWSDVVVAALANRAAARHVMLEHDDALVRRARNGQIIIDHTTVDPEFSRECEFEARRRGAFYIDAPLSGNPQAAVNGQLTVMAGGDADALLKVQPLLRFYAENVTRMGASGSGSAAKAICQALVAIHTVAAAEALRLAHDLGVEDSRRLISVLDSSWASSTMLRRNAPTMQNLLRNPDMQAPTSSASVGSLLNDLSLLDGSSAGGGHHLTLLAAARRAMEATERAADAQRDIASVVQFLDATVATRGADDGHSRGWVARATDDAGLAAGAAGGPLLDDLTGAGAPPAPDAATAAEDADSEDAADMEFY